VFQPKELKSEALKQADIVILDWQLGDDTPDRALALLRELLTGSMDQNALRLVAIYTGEPDLGRRHRFLSCFRGYKIGMHKKKI